MKLSVTWLNVRYVLKRSRIQKYFHVFTHSVESVSNNCGKTRSQGTKFHVLFAGWSLIFPLEVFRSCLRISLLKNCWMPKNVNWIWAHQMWLAISVQVWETKKIKWLYRQLKNVVWNVNKIYVHIVRRCTSLRKIWKAIKWTQLVNQQHQKGAQIMKWNAVMSTKIKKWKFIVWSVKHQFA